MTLISSCDLLSIWMYFEINESILISSVLNDLLTVKRKLDDRLTNYAYSTSSLLNSKDSSKSSTLRLDNSIIIISKDSYEIRSCI